MLSLVYMALEALNANVAICDYVLVIINGPAVPQTVLCLLTENICCILWVQKVASNVIYIVLVAISVNSALRVSSVPEVISGPVVC
ncbi:hypothetical protein ANPL_03615 [Anaplasma platys]|uniref:Uncharacterized protein n=1 Tax=Anaplasma platys TaxID=949 RepID=A0A858PYY4_9RICK|nr:hypothetical protein ANPL_03615 [Anaplasma platys]